MPAAASALLETVNLPTLLFIGTLLPARLEKGISFTLQDDLGLALGMAFRGFPIQQHGLLCRSALAVECSDGDIPTVVVFADQQSGADLDFLAGFAALAVDMNLAAGNGIGGKFAGLEKTRRPEPLVQADGIDFRRLADSGLLTCRPFSSHAL